MGRRSEPPGAEAEAERALVPPASRTHAGAAGTPVGTAGTRTPVGAVGTRTPVGVATAPVGVASDLILPAMRNDREWVHYMCRVRGDGEEGG